MISLTRLNGERIAVNPDLIERAEQTPDTVLTLTNGTKYVVHETIEELTERIQIFRATVLAISRRLAEDPDVYDHFRLHLVRDNSDGQQTEEEPRTPGSGAPS
ncbi:MAG TPA: flagellar FlbD family protein [Acidimicrobiales bacterium]|nr:flagellar FlbD family protein [Acidimicrobiales bacterium]